MHLPAEIKTGAKASFELLNQMEERKFEDIRNYRIYQRSLLDSLDEDTSYKDIDFILGEGDDFEEAGNFRIIDDEEWKRDQLYRASEKIAEELKTYEAILHVIDLEDMSDLDLDDVNKEAYRQTNQEGETRAEKMYDSLKRDIGILHNGLAKLPEQTDLDYTEPLEELGQYSGF